MMQDKLNNFVADRLLSTGYDLSFNQLTVSELEHMITLIQNVKKLLSPDEKDVHTEHCCYVHGCKYNDEDCTVVSGFKKQSYPCEDCLVGDY